MKIRFWRMMFSGKHDHATKHHTFVIVIILLLVLFPCIAVAQSSNPSSSPSSPNDGFPTTGRYKFSPAMSVIFVIIVVVFFVVGCVSVFAGQCIDSNSPRSSLFIMHQVNRRSRRARHQGLEPNVIDTFPTFLYSDVKKVRTGKGNVGLECSICLNEFKDEETLRLIPKCCHVFHPECIDTWLISHVTCPVCRADLVPVSGETGMDNCDIPSRDSEDYSTRPTWVDVERGQVHVDENRATDVELDSSSSHQVIKSIQLSNSEMQRVEGKFPRSHSTGHSLIQPWNDYERFTLRLPQDVQKKLMKPELVRAKSNLVFPSASASSAKRGFRSSSLGPGLGLPIHSSYEQSDHEGRRDRWGFTVAPPFFTRSRSGQATIGGDNLNNTIESGSSSKPIKTSFDWFGGTSSKDESGERSFARLIGKSQV